MSNSFWPHGLQHARLPCPPPTPGAYSSSCPPSQWCHPTTSSSVGPFSSHLQSFPASGSFPVSQFFASGDQSIGVSASVTVLSMNFQGCFPLGLTVFFFCFFFFFFKDWLVLSPWSPRDSSPTPQFKSFNSSVLRSIHDYWKNHRLWLDKPLLAK